MYQIFSHIIQLIPWFCTLRHHCRGMAWQFNASQSRKDGDTGGTCRAELALESLGALGGPPGSMGNMKGI